MKKIIEAVDKHRTLILEAERHIWKNPETGYKEFKTTAYLADKFRSLGYDLTMADGITGFYTRIDTGVPGPEVLILGELDSVICPEHPESDPETGAVHSCGHNAQCATLLGIAAALKEPGILGGLSGAIRLCCVPAEEMLEIEYRTELKKKSIIRYLGGKSEFLYRGYFDGVDIAFMVHMGRTFSVNAGSVGFNVKNTIYKGKAAHAGGSPWNGVNALYAANLGLSAVNALRETFPDTDLIRYHPIITSGGSMVNAIPAEVKIESYVRGRTAEAIKSTSDRIDRALIGAAYAIGANVEIIDMPGYQPLYNDPGMIETIRLAAALIAPELEFTVNDVYSTGSTDMGDLSCIMPVVHPYVPGTSGSSHGCDYQITDPTLACVMNAKWQLATLNLLLSDGAKRARKIIESYKPVFSSKEEFLAYQDSINSSGDRIEYLKDGGVKIR